MHDKIRAYLLEHSPQVNKFSDDECLLELGIIDSMSMVGLIAYLEQEFGLHVNDDDMTPENFESVNSIARFIELKKSH